MTETIPADEQPSDLEKRVKEYIDGHYSFWAEETRHKIFLVVMHMATEKECAHIFELSEAHKWAIEYKNCREILVELFYLKVLKDTLGKTEEYHERQPLAWKAAKEFLSTYRHQSKK